MSPTRWVVTFDLFSALLDSRTGGSTAFGALGLPATGEQLYDAWDPRNKAAQRDGEPGAPWRVSATHALTDAYAALGLDADPAAGVEALVASMPRWPLWPDVASGLPVLAEVHRVGLLSNVDDELFRSTAAADLVDPEVAFTSERLGASKPHPAIYQRAVERVDGPLVHVATSARDVRGALEAGIAVVRLRRPGHELDPAGPRPTYEVSDVGELADVLPSLRR